MQRRLGNLKMFGDPCRLENSAGSRMQLRCATGLRRGGRCQDASFPREPLLPNGRNAAAQRDPAPNLPKRDVSRRVRGIGQDKGGQKTSSVSRKANRCRGPTAKNRGWTFSGRVPRRARVDVRVRDNRRVLGSQGVPGTCAGSQGSVGVASLRLTVTRKNPAPVRQEKPTRGP